MAVKQLFETDITYREKTHILEVYAPEESKIPATYRVIVGKVTELFVFQDQLGKWCEENKGPTDLAAMIGYEIKRHK